MNCYYHPESPAVACCSVCGKGLCVSCASESQICPSCRIARIKKSVKSALIYLVILLVLGLIGYNWDFMGRDGNPECFLSAYCLVSICTGAYLLLGKFQRPAGTILVYDADTYGFIQLFGLIIKAVLAFAVGILVTPIVIIWQLFRLISNAQKLRDYRKSGRMTGAFR